MVGRRGWLVVFLAQQADLSGRLGATGSVHRLQRVDWGHSSHFYYRYSIMFEIFAVLLRYLICWCSMLAWFYEMKNVLKFLYFLVLKKISTALRPFS